MNVLRPSLLPGLLDSLRHNVSRKNEDVALFEIGRVFVAAGGQIQGGTPACHGLDRTALAAFWAGAERDAKFDIYDLKGILGGISRSFRIARRVLRAPRASRRAFFWNPPPFNSANCPSAKSGNLRPPRRNVLRPARRRFSGGTEFRFAAGPAQCGQIIQAVAGVSRHPPRCCDAGAGSNFARSCAECRASKPNRQIWKSPKFFDVFRGKNVPEGQKSLAYAFTYRNPERTLDRRRSQHRHSGADRKFGNPSTLPSAMPRRSWQPYALMMLAPARRVEDRHFQPRTLLILVRKLLRNDRNGVAFHQRHGATAKTAPGHPAAINATERPIDSAISTSASSSAQLTS